MRDYAISCEGTRKYASLASVCEAPFCARYASSHARKYAPTPLKILPTRESKILNYYDGFYWVPDVWEWRELFDPHFENLQRPERNQEADQTGVIFCVEF